MPSPATVDRWSASGTVSFSSTLSQSVSSAVRWERSSSDRSGACVVAVAISPPEWELTIELCERP